MSTASSTQTLWCQGRWGRTPTETDKDRFVRSLPSQFASWPKEQQEYLARAELRLVDLVQVHDGTIKTRAIVDADIRKNVHSSGDVWREARQVENDAEYGARYYQLYRAEAFDAITNAKSCQSRCDGSRKSGPVGSEERGHQYSDRTALKRRGGLR